MKTFKLGIALLYLTFCVTNISKAQLYDCGFTSEELAEFGPWICPQYVPSPGFPGSSQPAMLQEVVIPRPPTGSPFGAYPIVVASPTFPHISFTYNTAPCAGDPLKNMKIAPSSPGNYSGGTYGYTRNGGTKFHDGIDIAAPRGVNLYSSHAGIVTDIRSSFSPGQYQKSSYGNYITIKSTVNGQDVYLKYNHLDGVSSNLMVGSGVAQGAFIGITGSTGNAAALGVIPHVHIQAKDNNGNKVDPAPYISTKFNKINGVGTKPCN